MHFFVQTFFARAVTLCAALVWLGCSGSSSNSSGATGLSGPGGVGERASMAGPTAKTSSGQAGDGQHDSATREPSGSADTHKGAQASDRGTGSTTGTQSGSEPAARASGALSRPECNAWIDHFLALAQNDHGKKVKPEHRPTPEQVQKIRDRLAPELMKACLKLDRATYECEMRAADQPALVACSQKNAPS